MPEVGEDGVLEPGEAVIRCRIRPLYDRRELEVVPREDEPSALPEHREHHREFRRPHLRRFVDDQEVERREGLLEFCETVDRPAEEEGGVADDGIGPVMGQCFERPLAARSLEVPQLVYREGGREAELVDRFLHLDEQILDGSMGERCDAHPYTLPVRPPCFDEGEEGCCKEVRLPGAWRPPDKGQAVRQHLVMCPGLAGGEPAGLKSEVLCFTDDLLRFIDRGGEPTGIPEEPDECVPGLFVQGEKAIDTTLGGKIGEPGMEHRDISLSEGWETTAVGHPEDKPPDLSSGPVDYCIMDPCKAYPALPGVRAVPVAEVVKRQLSLFSCVSVRDEEVAERLRLLKQSEVKRGEHLPEVPLDLFDGDTGAVPDPLRPWPAPEFLRFPDTYRRLILRYEEEARYLRRGGAPVLGEPESLRPPHEITLHPLPEAVEDAARRKQSPRDLLPDPACDLRSLPIPRHDDGIALERATQLVPEEVVRVEVIREPGRGDRRQNLGQAEGEGDGKREQSPYLAGEDDERERHPRYRVAFAPDDTRVLVVEPELQGILSGHGILKRLIEQPCEEILLVSLVDVCLKRPLVRPGPAPVVVVEGCEFSGERPDELAPDPG